MAFNGWAGRALLGVLLLQAAGYYAVASRSEIIPSTTPLSLFPQTAGGWESIKDYPLEKEVQDLLRADDSLSRLYVSPDKRASASLFVAFFKTQRQGQSPHSPKNCMPGSGWAPTRDRKIMVSVPGHAPIQVNDYVIQRENDQSVVLYWYQSHQRAIAGEVAAKFWLVADAIRHHRSDTALVRIIVPVRENEEVDAAERTAIEFTQAVYPQLVRQLPK